MRPERLAEEIRALTVRDLLRLNDLLRDLPGWGGLGVREPRRPIRPQDSTTVTKSVQTGWDSDTTDVQGFHHA